MPLFKTCGSHEKIIAKWDPQTSVVAKLFYNAMKTISLPFYALKAFLCLRRSRSNHFQLYVNATAFCKNAVSGTPIISICGRVFSCLLLIGQISCHKSQCDKEKDIHGLQNPCIMLRLIYTHTCTHIPFHYWRLTQTFSITIICLTLT